VRSKYIAVLLLSVVGLFPNNSNALTLEQCVREEMIHSLLTKQGVTPTSDQNAHRSYYTRKAIRTLIETARPSEHGFKHTSARTVAEAREKSFQIAQYLPGLNHLLIERTAMRSQTGEWFAHGNTTLYKFVRLDKPVGFDQGEETRWIRVEISSGVFHGHPMSVARVRKYVKDAQW